jgi:2-desacetyl-2-hydroxyethyl bacteriochlorophyllide A dehydrogenase
MEARIIDRSAIVMQAPLEAQFVPSPLKFAGPGTNHLLVQTEYSVISAGTELAVYQGLESWAPLPFIPGYGSVGRVLEVGDSISGIVPGDRVFTFGSHASINLITEGVVVKTPDSVPAYLLPLAIRMGEIATTSLRVSSAELGDFVAVQGLGLVGNLAAQQFKLAGCKVIGIDVSAKRLDAARACGIDLLINSAEEDAAAAVRKITGGEMSQVVVEATGLPTLAGIAIDFAAVGGELILLGSPRGKYEGSATPLLWKVHEAKTNVTLKGAHEWSLPIKPTPGIKHSMERNAKMLIDLLVSGNLHVKELITHIVKPIDAPFVYKELYGRNDNYFGVIIDWTDEK